MPVVSIIVPVYNVEMYLAACLASILTQTVQDIEVICVNDGSTDSSGEILKTAAAVDPRIRVIVKQNGGLSSARNAGIDAATGSYIMFVDSDDILEKGACAKVITAFKTHKAELVTFGANIYPPQAADEWLARALSPRDIVYEAFHIDILFKERSRPYAVRTACSREFIQRTGLRFDETVHVGEDTIFHFMAYPQAACTVFLSDKLYGYQVRQNDSLMATHNEKKPLKIRKHVLVVERILASWRLEGWLQQYPSVMLAWAFSFLLFDISRLDSITQQDLLRAFKHILAAAFEGIDVMDHPDTKAVTKRMYRRILTTSDIGPVPRLGAFRALYWYLRHPEMGTGFKRFVKAPITILKAFWRRIGFG